MGTVSSGRSDRSFNSATASGPWRTTGPKAHPRHRQSPSIRPRPRGRGEPPLECRQVPGDCSFNSATASGPWRTLGVTVHDRRPGQPSIRPRPRGRGEQRAIERRVLGDVPSIRPRPRGRGERSTERSHPHRGIPFNSATASGPWRTFRPARHERRRDLPFNSATASGPWRTRTARLERLEQIILQFGHGLGAVENGGYGVVRSFRSVLQFGHGLGAVENNGAESTSTSPPIAFNSATASGPWRTPARMPTSSGRLFLQFGHGLGAVENPRRHGT